MSSYMLGASGEGFQNSSSQQQVKVVGGYALQQRLGSGSFAVVYKGVRMPRSANAGDSLSSSHSPSPDVVACKAISRTSEKLTKKVLQNLEIEISILRTYRHANIVCMHEVLSLARVLRWRRCAGLDSVAWGRTIVRDFDTSVMRDLSAGLKFLWGQELIHRDIKPQNLLLTGPLPADEVNDPGKITSDGAILSSLSPPSTEFNLKIADFGFARHLQSASLAETLCGSPIYMAPEILQHQR
jgi:serine/threonine-protein kinase ULK2